MPGGTAHTAGGEKLDGEGPSYIDAVRSLGPEYYLNFHKRPCVRDSQLQGIAAGFAGGALAGIIGSASQNPNPSSRPWRGDGDLHSLIVSAEPVLVASNWAVATWCGVSVLSYQVCQYYRSKEKAGPTSRRRRRRGGGRRKSTSDRSRFGGRRRRGARAGGIGTRRMSSFGRRYMRREKRDPIMRLKSW
jgi:hypothetical protein